MTIDTNKTKKTFYENIYIKNKIYNKNPFCILKDSNSELELLRFYNKAFAELLAGSLADIWASK